MKRLTLLTLTILSFLAACSELDQKTPQEKTIDLLTAGVWKVDTLRAQVISEAPGMKVIDSDSLFINYGTWEFQSPKNEKNPGFNTGYLIHKYTKNTVLHTDTLAWAPYNFNLPTSDIDQLSVFYPDPSKAGRQIVVSDILNMFLYLKKENNAVRIEGGFSFSVGSGATTVSNYKRYHLSK